MLDKNQIESYKRAVELLEQGGSHLDAAKLVNHYDVDRHKRVAQLRQNLEEGYSERYAQLEASWQKLSSEYGGVDRGESAGYEILPEMLTYINSGYYPPPELLLWLTERFEVYLEGKGDIPLEDALICSPIPHAGNFSARSKSGVIEPDLLLQFELDLKEGKENGQNQHEVAEQFIKEFEVPIEPESLLRLRRRQRAKDR